MTILLKHFLKLTYFVGIGIEENERIKNLGIDDQR